MKRSLWFVLGGFALLIAGGAYVTYEMQCQLVERAYWRSTPMENILQGQSMPERPTYLLGITLFATAAGAACILVGFAVRATSRSSRAGRASRKNGTTDGRRDAFNAGAIASADHHPEASDFLKTIEKQQND